MTARENGGALTPALEPCPYCGSVTRINSYSKRIGKTSPSLFQSAQVKCKRQSCGMSGPLAKGEGCRRRAAEMFNRAWASRAARPSDTGVSDG